MKWLREHIGTVSQEPILFALSIKDNIKMGRENVTDEELYAAAKMANAYNFIMDLPEVSDVKIQEYSVTCILLFVCLMVFNATFNNISVISWWSVLLVEETGGP